MPDCRICGESQDDWKQLALHIIKNKKTHRKGLNWARKFLSKQQILDRRLANRNREHITLTDEDIASKQDSRREISGQMVRAKTICPRGYHPDIQELPVEYTESPEAWRIQDRLVVVCAGHRREH